MSVRSALGFAVAMCTTVALADVLHLQDGSQVQGKVTSCDEESCSIDKKRVALAGILRISLGKGANVPPGTAAGLVLTDGSMREGKFQGLSLGFVELDGEEIDREHIAEIILTARPPADVLVGIDGRTTTGALTTCNAASCTFAGQVHPFGTILWLGIGQEGNAPPDAGNSDLVIADDNARLAARLSGLDATTIRTTRGSFPRANVKWIRLAQQAPPAQPGGPYVRPTPPELPPEPAPISDPPPPPPTSPAFPVYGTAGEQLPRGRLWVGKLIARLWSASESKQSLDVSVDVRLREHTRSIVTDAPRKKIAEAVYLNEEGTVVNNAYRSSDGAETCTGASKTTINHPTGIWSSVIYRRTAAGPMPRLMGFDIRRDAPFYMLAIGPYYPPIPMIPITCVEPGRTRTLDLPFLVPMAGTLPTGTVSFDTQIRHFDNGRMIGSYTGSGGGGFDHAAASWSICLEGTVCPPPTPLDPEAAAGTGETPPPDPCARSGQQQALAETCRAQLDEIVASLEPKMAAYNEMMKNVEANRNAFGLMKEFCRLYDHVKAFLEAIVSSGTGPTAEAVQGLMRLRDLIEKVQEGDLPSILYPEEVQAALDAFKRTKDMWMELTADEVTKMRHDLSECSGKAPPDTYMKAKQFVEDSAAARQFWETQFAPAMNDARSKGQECASRNHAAWRACLEAAECEGQPPNCGPEPSH